MTTKVEHLPTAGKPEAKIIADASKFGKHDDDPAPAAQEPKQQRQSPFEAKTASQWLAAELNRPIPKKLFGDFVIEDEITCLFASTNVGKSIIAVQMAQAIASGEGKDPFIVQGGGRVVTYIDFELSGRQFARRYSKDNGYTFCDPFQFHSNFIRLENRYADPAPGQTMTEYYLQSIADAVDEHGATVVLIDNVTWIASKLEKAADAAPFMQGLIRLKRDKELTIVLLAHTPKRDQTRPLDIYDLQGSAMVSNFIDAAFCIGRSQQDGSIRYIKQVKARDAEIVCGADHVAVCTLEKDGNFLGFTFRHYEEEHKHLHQPTQEESSGKEAKVLELHQQGKSYRAIADEIGNMSHQTAKRIIERSKADEPVF